MSPNVCGEKRTVQRLIEIAEFWSCGDARRVERSKSIFSKWRRGVIVFLFLTAVGVGAVLMVGFGKVSRVEALRNAKIANGANVSVLKWRWLTELLLNSRSPSIREWSRSFASVHEFDNSNPPNEMTDQEMHLLAAFPELRRLNLSAAGITDEGVAKIRGLRKLEILSIRDTGVTDAGLTNLAGLTKLEELFLQSSKVRGAGLSNLAGLKELRTLRLDGLAIRDEHLRYLAGLTKLEKLDLGQTEVSGDGLKYLAGLTNLVNLSFVSNDRLRSEGLRHLLPLYARERSGTNECVLHMGWTEIDDAAVETLKQFRRLTRLNVNSTKISGSGLKELERALDGTKVEYYPNQLKTGR